MPPKEELFRPFEKLLPISHGKTQNVLEWTGVVRQPVAGSLLFWLRPQGAPVDKLFFCAVDSLLTVARCPPQNLDLFFEEWLPKFWSAKKLHRVVWLPRTIPDAPESWMILKPGEAGLVTGEGTHYANWNSPRFGFMAPDFVYDAPQTVLESCVERTAEAEPERWEGVVRWARMTPEERFWSLVSWERGNPSEWMGLMRALLQLDARRAPFAEERLTWRLDFAWDTKLPTLPVPLGMNPYDLNPYGLKSIPTKLAALAQQHFGAMVDYSQWRIKRARRSPFLPLLVNPAVTVTHPSQHERMEALELWRDFGRRSGQLARVEELLRELLA